MSVEHRKSEGEDPDLKRMLNIFKMIFKENYFYCYNIYIVRALHEGNLNTLFHILYLKYFHK